MKIREMLDTLQLNKILDKGGGCTSAPLYR